MPTAKGESAPVGRLVSILAKIPLLSGLNREDYQLLLQVCRVARYGAGEPIFAQGDIGIEMFVVLAGTVEVSSEQAGPLYTMEPGEVLGEIALVSRLRRTASARAGTDTALLCLSRPDLDSLVGRAPRISYLVMRHTAEVLAERLMAATERSGRYALGD